MTKLLVGVDDSQINRAIFEETARLMGAEVIVGENGADALAKMEVSVNAGKIPDLIITDINMPVMDGLTFIKKVKNDSRMKYIPILALTTETDFQKKMMGKELGAAGWLTKPLSPEDIVKVVNKFFQVR